MSVPVPLIALYALPIILQSQQLPGSISGIVVDETGASIAGALVKLSSEDVTQDQRMQSGDDGQFTFGKVAPGPFHGTAAAPGFAPRTFSGSILAGEAFTVPNIVLPVATLTTDVEVTLPPVELAQEQIRVAEKQRILGVLPNFNVTYLPDAVPLNARQKFELGWKTVIDPFSFVVNAIIAGVQQKENKYGDFGQGTEGYAKRYGSSYAVFFSGTMVGGALLPALLKQDPRYFVKGTGSKLSRLEYALANSVIRKGDNGHWQPNYSDFAGALVSGALSNLYYPAKNRDGAGLTFENAALGIGGNALGNVLQEFLFRKLTPKKGGVARAVTP